MRVSLLVAVSATLCLAPMAHAQETVEFMKVAELKQLTANGRTLPGHFKTVAQGETLSDYDVTIRDVSSEGGIETIIFTTRHFIVAGMSGSPVYALGNDGHEKLVGALAYFMSPFAVGEQWGGISPIERMNREAQEAKSAASSSITKAFSYRGKTFVPIAVGNEAIPGGVLRHLQEYPGLEQMLTQAKYTVTTRGVGEPSTTRTHVLKAGMPIVVDLLEFTDTNGTSTTIGATGTITYVGANGDIYAFGHPFMGARNARYSFRTCRITGTVYSNKYSYKMSGASSGVLGTIEYDGEYGIYGTVGGVDRRPLTTFTVDFLKDSKPTNSYQVRLSTSPMTLNVMEMALGMVGDAARVPFSRQPSTASVSATIELAGHKAIQFNQVYTSTQVQFGPSVIYISPYDSGCGAFLAGLYEPLQSTRWGFSITGARISFDFSDGVTPSLKVASMKFPIKVKFGSNPVLELTLVSEDNQVTLTRRVVVPIDWNTVEEPTYTADIKNTDKQAEKVVRGSAVVYTAEQFPLFLSDNEKELETPLYFLNAEDFLANFRKRLERNNRMLYGRVVVRKRSGTKGETIATAEGPSAGADGSEGWVLQKKGLDDRKVTVSEDPAVRFWANLPMVPPGYVVAPVQKAITFEVVK